DQMPSEVSMNSSPQLLKTFLSDLKLSESVVQNYTYVFLKYFDKTYLTLIEIKMCHVI
ncbi:MAG: hypothetical protein ACI97P_001161, partial [Arcticibacterium sp.]